MTLIPGWRRAWQFFSMQSMGLAVAIQGSWLALSAEQKASIPDEWVTATTVIVLILGAIGRLVHQGHDNA